MQRRTDRRATSAIDRGSPRVYQTEHLARPSPHRDEPRRLPPPRGFRATCSCHHPSNILNQSSRAGYTTIQTGLLVFQSLGVWRQVIVCIRGRSRLRPVSVRRPGRLGRGARCALEACRDYLLLVAEKRLGTDVRAKAGASDLVQDTFLEAQRDFGQFRGNSRREFRHWLRRILVHNLGSFTTQYRDTGKRDVHREVGYSALPRPAGSTSRWRSRRPLPAPE